MRALIAEVNSAYDRVILDTPVTLGLPDVKSVAECCDGVVLVIRSGKTDLDDIEECLDLLDRRRVLGLVLNGADVDDSRYEYK
jgi:Mrp family chromosome partitioning ATPase